jgi:AcrR family transcriptional regulator
MSYSTAGKAALIEQLRSVFVARGYDGATLNHLAESTGLSKASLYHHFPGGKPEMSAALVRHAIADLQQQAFSQLQAPAKPAQRLFDFIDGFVSYTKNGTTDCLLAVFSHHRTAAGDDEMQARKIALQFADWHKALAAVFEECGCKPKRANQDAQQLLSTLYGALLTAKMFDEQRLFLQAAKRCKKDIANRFA